MYDATTGLPVFAFDGTGASILAGSSVAVVGDVDGDSVEDVIVGAPQALRFTC